MKKLTLLAFITLRFCFPSAVHAADTTNQLSAGTIQIIDKLAADYLRRFYRAQLQ